MPPLWGQMESLQHLELQIVEVEGLSDVRDHARFMNDDACKSGRLLVGQVPVEGTVQVADRHRAIDEV